MAYYPKRCAQQLWKEKPNLENVKSIIWGKKHESVAREEYEKLHNCHVKEVGIFLSKIQPLIGASPDGMIDNGRGLLEIKCPYSLRTNNLKEDLEEVPKNSFFTLVNGKLCLKKEHPYHYQVQTQMFCTNARYTDFFI